MGRRNQYKGYPTLWPDQDETPASSPSPSAAAPDAHPDTSPVQTVAEERQECRDEQAVLDTFMRAAHRGRVDFPLMLTFQDSARWDPALPAQDREFSRLFGIAPENARRQGGAVLSDKRQAALGRIARRSHDAIDAFIINFTY